MSLLNESQRLGNRGLAALQKWLQGGEGDPSTATQAILKSQNLWGNCSPTFHCWEPPCVFPQKKHFFLPAVNVQNHSIWSNDVIESSYYASNKAQRTYLVHSSGIDSVRGHWIFVKMDLETELAGYSPNLIEALQDAGVTNLTPVQKQALPLALSGHDLMVKAKTGTGKTLAFLIPSVQRLLAATQEQEAAFVLPGGVDPVKVIVLSSTRELANQIVTQAKMLTSRIKGFNVDCVLGGVAVNPQKERLDPNCKGRDPYGGPIDVLVR